MIGLITKTISLASFLVPYKALIIQKSADPANHPFFQESGPIFFQSQTFLTLIV